MTDVEKLLTDIRFYDQVLGDARRTILCPPDLVDSVKAVVEARDVGGLYQVKASPCCPEGRLIVIDEQGLEAAMRETVQSFARGIRLR
ncbi:hypothetical protein [Streptomyces sp. BA2]|uniref:hypothetical protein n=1 Tax=Streptomyces sp. BA2 TaxID=436595 RepID=UPI0013261985|nr:hypothetical protein [Streptomyces sp. BA2]MWA08705.1 hypothetical protein [Streptomyces sp. BA2]